MSQVYPRPNVIFFDAVGTLFGVRGSVGEIYADLAKPYGVHADAKLLNGAFFRAFKAAPSMAFPGVDLYSIAAREFSWWKAIAQQTFADAGVLDQFSHFDHFFDGLYQHFATAKPWFVYPDTLETLKYWQAQGVEVGIISNFDSRIHQVLTALNLSGLFNSITISTEVGAAKPDSLIFKVALEKHHCLPSQAWHIGDTLRDDYEGARTAGLRGILLERS
ncbi:MAG: HAD family hydrolase [Merismopedia sp. SIO2A8]|nr:HAD family hydrolase [Symploca sp. SIO2B6]NET49855.1 HAD family hydrolase [Merismopedia sp. SIO2A8]